MHVILASSCCGPSSKGGFPFSALQLSFIDHIRIHSLAAVECTQFKFCTE